MLDAGHTGVEPVKILFAGGCHLAGYPVGAEYAFPIVVASQLKGFGIACESQTLNYIALRHPEKVVQACRQFQPDILILQLGNYELSHELRPYLLSRLGLKTKKKPSTATATVRDRRRYTLLARVKRWIDQCMGHPLVDFPAFSARFQAFLAATTSCAGQIIVTSSTPCADPTAQYYRLRAHHIIDAAAAGHNCVYVDLLALGPAVEERTLGRDMFFADAIHLGIAGHTAVGRCLALHLRKAVENCCDHAPIVTRC